MRIDEFWALYGIVVFRKWPAKGRSKSCEDTVMMRSHPDFRQFLIVGLALVVASCGGGGSSSNSNSFPTPVLPAGARTITPVNADETAASSTEFMTILSDFTQLKTEDPPSIGQLVDRVIEQVIRPNRARSLTGLKTENLSSIFCLTGSAVADYDESASSESGSLTFANCDIGVGVLVNGKMVYDSNWNDTTLAYSIHIGGTITFNISPQLVTIVINQTESGNDGTGTFSSNISYSLDGIPGGGFLVTTTQNLVGDFGVLTSGQLIVSGSANSRLRITVTGSTSADVELDDGSGTFVSCVVVAGCTTPITF